MSTRYKILIAVLVGAAFLLTPHSSLLTPTARADCDPTTCCNCQNAWTDADNDGYTVGGAVSVCFDPGAPSGYRAQPSAQPDCNDSDPTVGPAPSNYGQACSTCNTCGSCSTGTINCKGVCSAAAPPLPSNYGQPCSVGSCTGTYGCTGVCNPTSSPPTWYRDVDGDGYGSASSGTIQSCTQPAGYVSNNTDCYDSNANAHPGQINYFTTNRGDGSFDYNCNGTTDLMFPYDSEYIPSAICTDGHGGCVPCYLYVPGHTLGPGDCGSYFSGWWAGYDDYYRYLCKPYTVNNRPCSSSYTACVLFGGIYLDCR